MRLLIVQIEVAFPALYVRHGFSDESLFEANASLQLVEAIKPKGTVHIVRCVLQCLLGNY